MPDPLEKGTVIGDRFEIQEQIGQSDIARSFLALPTDRSSRRKVTIKLLHPSLGELFRSFEPTLVLAKQCNHRHLSRLLEFGLHGESPFIVLEYVRGQTLKHLIERKETTHSRFSPRTALSLVAPIGQALSAIHQHIPHGTLTSRNIYVERNGRVCVANLGFGWLVEQALQGLEKGAQVDSPFIAPEVRSDPASATPSSDIYSLGMITICLLAGRSPTLQDAENLATRLLRRVPESLRELISSCIADQASDRPASVNEYLDALQNGIEDLRDQIILEKTGEYGQVQQQTAPPGPPPIPTDHEALLAQVTTLSGLLAIPDLPPAPDDGADPLVWLIHRDGFDYGPYSSEQVREQLLNDAVDEFTQVRNLENQESGFLGQIDEFKEFVEEYIPVREERRHREALRRAEVQKKVKRASATGFITALIGLIGLLGIYGYYLEFMRAKPQPIALQSLFAHLPTDFAPPDHSYIGIEADPALMASLFDFDEDEEQAPRRHRRRRSVADDATQSDLLQEEDYDPSDLGTIDFTRGGGRRLTADDINETISGHAGPIRGCLRAELRTNPRFGSGGRPAMRFTIRPDGRPVGVDMQGGSFSQELRNCLVPIFRSMRFPEHNELSLPVTYPFEVTTR